MFKKTRLYFFPRINLLLKNTFNTDGAILEMEIVPVNL